MRKKKFTLVEMLCVVAIIAILCGIIFGVAGAVRNRNAEIKTRAMLKQIEIALEECKQKFGYYPGSGSVPEKLERDTFFMADGDDKDENTVAKRFSIAFKKACNYTSLEVIKEGSKYYIVDAWGTPLKYQNHSNKSYTLYSLGPDFKDHDDSDVDENEDGIPDFDEDNITIE